jgi:hypothetical protein
MLMKHLIQLLIFCFAVHATAERFRPEQGFAFLESVEEVTIRYRKYNNLIVISPWINDTLQVNLILDTGCRSVVLFGKKFLKYFDYYERKPIAFSGLGRNKPIKGYLSIGNTIGLDGIVGKAMSVVVVPNRNIFAGSSSIDGVIGYDLLSRFELEVDPVSSTVTFRCAMKAIERGDLLKFDLLPEKLLPHVAASINTEDGLKDLLLLIDTGSQLGLLYKSGTVRDHELVGKGFCGNMYGEISTCNMLTLDGYEVSSGLPMAKTPITGSDCLSIGMEFLKNSTFIINLVRGYFQLSNVPRDSGLQLPDSILVRNIQY